MKYHLIGSQGVSMKGIKKILENMGHEVFGSDIKTGGHSAKNITNDIDFVIRTSAVNPGSPGWVEILKAKELNIPVLKRSQILSQIIKDKKVIAISGMHGKTTTTALIGSMLIRAKFDPTVLVGENVPQFNNDVVRIGKSKYFVLEACEYDKSFLDIDSDIAIITNIDQEHLDTYPGGIKDIKMAFSKFIRNIKKNGKLIYCGEDENVREVVKNAPKHIELIPYGKGSSNYSKLDFISPLLGRHNELNTLAACALGESLGIQKLIIKDSIENYQGAKRRLEYRGEVKGMKVYDDYGHHPTEITATISAICEKYPNFDLYVVFLPHQYLRIKPLLSKFAKAFGGAKEVILKPIFLVPGRDKKVNVSSEDLAELINKSGIKAKVYNKDEEIAKYLLSKASNVMIVLTIGIPSTEKIINGIFNE